MTEPTRWVVIDDKDSRIQYSSGWESNGGDHYNKEGNFGATYRNSLQSTVTNGSKLSFTFRGNAARIKGTIHAMVDSAGVPDPDWDCIVDGRVVRRGDAFPYVENNWVFCGFSDLTGGEHTIELVVKTNGRNFWFDYIEYRPIGTVDNEVVLATRDDADLAYSGKWSALAEVAHATTDSGSSATFRFIGTGVSLYAMFPKELSHADGQATYTIDGGSSTTFTIPGGGDTSVYNRQIFGVTGLSKQAHTIVMTYTSNGGATPLVISQLLIEGGTNTRAAESGGGSSGGGSSGVTPGSSSTTVTVNPNSGTTISVSDTTSTNAALNPGGPRSSSGSGSSTVVYLPGDNATPSDVAGGANGGKNGGSGTSGLVGSDQAGASKSGVPVGAIVGAVVGAIAVILLLLIIMWYRRRRRIQLRDDMVPQAPFSMTREGTQDHTPVAPMHHAFPPSSMSAVYGSEAPVFVDGVSSPPSSIQAPIQHPAHRTKQGPAFNSPYISNHPYNDEVPNATTESSAHLIPTGDQHNGHHHQGSIDHSTVSAYTAYTDTSQSSGARRALFHEDSGIRLPAQGPAEVVEYPPMYSAR